MDATSTIIQFTSSSPRTSLKKFVSYADLRIILLIGVTFLLLNSIFDMNHMLPEAPLINSDQYTNTWFPYDGAPPHSSPLPKHTRTPRPQWKAIDTFKALGSKKTYPFIVPQHWRILWSCGNTEQSYYSLTIEVARPDGSIVDPTAAITQCQQAITSATVQEHIGGTVYLNVDSDSGWTVQVQVLTSAPAKISPIRWKTQQTLHGNGNDKTLPFTVPRHWQMRWQCTLARKNDIDVLFADLDRTDNTVADPGAINAICKNGNIRDWTQEYKAGTYYLNVFSNTSWTVQIQFPQ